MSDPDALERRLLPPKAKGTPEEFWLVVTRRYSLVEGADPKHGKQHLAMAALFAGRGFQAGERDATRLTTYLAVFREAQATQCFPAQLEATQARILNQLRTAGGISAPELLAKKAKNVFTHLAMYLVSDGNNFETISNDDGRWADDKGMRGTVQAGLGLFIYTGADGTIRLEVRVVDGESLALGPREYTNLASSTSRSYSPFHRAGSVLDSPSRRVKSASRLLWSPECTGWRCTASRAGSGASSWQHAPTWGAPGLKCVHARYRGSRNNSPNRNLGTVRASAASSARNLARFAFGILCRRIARRDLFLCKIPSIRSAKPQHKGGNQACGRRETR